MSMHHRINRLERLWREQPVDRDALAEAFADPDVAAVVVGQDWWPRSRWEGGPDAPLSGTTILSVANGGTTVLKQLGPGQSFEDL